MALESADKTPRSRPMINSRFPAPPFWMTSLGLISACLAILLFATIMRSRMSHSPLPRVHFIQDMDNQVKVKTQHTSLVFPDGRGSRPKVIGTIARGQFQDDDHLYRGFTASWNEEKKVFDTTFLNGIPVTVDDALMTRGQIKFNTYCMPCHGYDGAGNGPVNLRAMTLAQNPKIGMSWVTPSNIHDETRIGRADGHIYNTVTNGIRNMGGYSASIPDVRDRWAVVAYVRALQLSHTGSTAKKELAVAK